MAITVRPILPADREPLVALLRRVDVFDADEVEVAVELIDESLTRPPGCDYETLVAADEAGRVLGYTTYGPTPLTAQAWDLYWIAVDPDTRGQGVGRLIVAALAGDVRARGGRVVWLETSSREGYEATLAFYGRAGFTCAGRVRDFYAPGEDLLTWYLRLDAPPAAPPPPPVEAAAPADRPAIERFLASLPEVDAALTATALHNADPAFDPRYATFRWTDVVRDAAGEIIALGVYGRAWIGRTGYDLVFLGVAPAHRDRGHAARLLAALEARVANAGGGVIRAALPRHRHPALECLLRTRGFAVETAIPSFYADAVDLVVLTKASLTGQPP